jgi:hypothetical protein
VLHLGQHDARVGLFPDHAAQRRRNEATWQDPGCDLIQQRLEQVMIGPVHDRDVDIGAGQGTRHPDPAEPATDDDHLVSSLAHEDSISGRGFPSDHPPAAAAGGQPFRMRAFCCSNSAWVSTPADSSSPSCFSWASRSLMSDGCAGAAGACGGGTGWA